VTQNRAKVFRVVSKQWSRLKIKDKDNSSEGRRHGSSSKVPAW
jgi:hypothetical protein